MVKEVCGGNKLEFNKKENNLFLVICTLTKDGIYVGVWFKYK